MTKMITDVTPVEYRRNQVNGLEALRNSRQQILQGDAQRTDIYRQALAQKAYNENLARQQQEQQAFLAQQRAYNANLGTTNFGGSSYAQVSNPRQADRAAVSGTGIGNQAVQLASQYIGMPYKWGGSNPNTSFDCSGLVQYVYGRLGINLPRVSNQQAISGQRTAVSNLRPGDLVAWDNSSRNNGADHIAIYAGNGQVIEAARAGTNIRYRTLSQSDYSKAWGVRLSY